MCVATWAPRKQGSVPFCPMFPLLEKSSLLYRPLPPSPELRLRLFQKVPQWESHAMQPFQADGLLSSPHHMRLRLLRVVFMDSELIS